jgi:hypothetical protein
MKSLTRTQLICLRALFEDQLDQERELAYKGGYDSYNSFLAKEGGIRRKFWFDCCQKGLCRRDGEPL